MVFNQVAAGAGRVSNVSLIRGPPGRAGETIQRFGGGRRRQEAGSVLIELQERSHRAAPSQSAIFQGRIKRTNVISGQKKICNVNLMAKIE